MLIIEILMLIAGVWAIATGKIPSILFGGAKYKLEGRGVRLLGLILVLPIPLSFITVIILAFIVGDQATEYSGLIEVIIVLVCGIAAVVVSRYIRQMAIPSTSGDDVPEDQAKIEATIARKAQGSLIYALLGILGFTAIVVCPLAFIRANQAIQLIDKYNIGEQYRRTANTARIIAPIIFIFYAGIAVIILAVGLRG
jgi:hypothetical protein